MYSLKKFGCKISCPYFRNPKEKTEDFVAQLVEQYTFNVWALGSSPSGITKELSYIDSSFFFTNFPFYHWSLKWLAQEKLFPNIKPGTILITK